MKNPGRQHWPLGFAILILLSLMMIIVPVTRRSLIALLACGLLLLCGQTVTAEHAPPPAGAASSYPAFEVHADEHVTIAADPYNTKEKASCFRIDYLKYGFMPIRVIVTNDGDKPINLEQARIHFITASGDKIPAAETEDVERRISNPKNDSGPTVSVPGLPHKTRSKNPKIDADFQEFEYQALVVEPHTTRAGFLFYDVQDLGDNPLKGAKLYLRRLQASDGKDLFYFEIPFDKYLAVGTK
jgi:hypothetical protein